MKRIAALLGLVMLAFGFTAVVASPASAQDGHYPVAGWSANGESTVVDATTVKLTGGGALGTSVETGNLNINVNEGDIVSFKYELLDGAECAGGAPRVYVVVNGASAAHNNSWDGNPGQCGVDGAVSFAVDRAGLITAAGLVFDNGSGGAIIVKKLKVAGKLVLFTPPVQVSESPSPSPTASESPNPNPSPTATSTLEPTPTPTPTLTPTPEPSTSDPAAVAGGGKGGGDKLPVTGAALPVLLGAGSLLLGTGGGLAYLTRKRRPQFTA